MPNGLKRSFAMAFVLLTMATAFAADPVGVAQSAEATQAQPESTPPNDEPQGTSEAPKTTKFSLQTQSEALKLTDDISTARQQLRQHPGDPEAHFLMAAAYSRSPYLERAFKHIKKVKELLKQNQDFEFIDRTIGEYESLIQANPSDTIVLYRLAMGYYFKGYCIEKYAHHFKNGPTGTAGEYYQKSQDTMSQVIKLDPKDTWARNYLGYLVSDNGKDLAKAISIWQESLAIDSQHNPGAYLLLSQAYLQKGDLQNALIYGAKGLEVKQAMGMTLP